MTKDNAFVDAYKKLRIPELLKYSPTKFKKSISSRKASPGHVNMGKSNKFDYTNRANSGAKLGQIIGSALQKEAEKVKKDADRHLQKARKQSADSTGGHSVNSDDLSTTHIIDLKVPGKELGDEGVFALADGMEAALKNASTMARLALEDLNLCGNNMTTASLARLAPIIQLAKYDLKTLNLSGNQIKVETDEQAVHWQTFLRAFKNCFRLRRLDLSDNAELGTRAMEILARVHISEQPIDPINPDGNASVLSVDSEGQTDDFASDVGSRNSVDEGGIGVMHPMANARLIKRRCGLRSIPYLTLHNIGLEDAGALWLSYVVVNHHYPTQLIDELNATNAESVIKTYQQDTNSSGIDWTGNASLGKERIQLLERIETLRQQTVLEEGATLAGSVMEGDGEDGADEEEHPQRQSLDRRHARAAQGDRRVSIRSIRTDDGGEHEATELERARKKIQRFIISHDGASSVELWITALKVFQASRLLLYIAPTIRKYHTGEPLFALPRPEIPTTVTVQPPTPADSPVRESAPQLTIDTAKANNSTPADRASYASTLAATGHPESALTDVTNTPTTPLMLQKRTTRKGAFSEGTELQITTDKLNVLMMRDANPGRFVRYQLNRIAESEHGFRDRSTSCHLPKEIMGRIIGLVLAKREVDVLSEIQMRAAIERGQRRETLMAEREWLKKDESAQVWILLDSVQCLAYGE